MDKSEAMIKNIRSNFGNKVVFVTTFPPRQCGIATFSEDLVSGLETAADSSFSYSVCSLIEPLATGQSHTGKTKQQHDRRVEYTLDSSSVDACMEMANILNRDEDIRLVVFEHEFGLYGGDYGQNLLSLLAMLDKPSAIRFHTVLPGPNETLKKTVHHIDQFVDHILVMTKNSREILERDYNVQPAKITVIPHGIHEAASQPKSDLKEEFGIHPDTLILSNFGLLSENKNIEFALKALATVKKSFPDFLFLIIGKTHPSVFKNEGERYRNSLKELVRVYGLEENVQFINRFVSLDELLDFLAITDIYLFTSKDPNQAVSGTLTYAMNAGCAVITTPIAQSREVVTPEVGRITPYGDVNEFARNISELALDRELRENMGAMARFNTQNNTWSNVAKAHITVFTEMLEKKVAVVQRVNEKGA